MTWQTWLLPTFQFDNINLTTDANQFAICAFLSQETIGKDVSVSTDYLGYQILPFLFIPLEYPFSLKDGNSTLLRWKIRPDHFTQKIIYHKTEGNNAYSLNRVKIHTKDVQSIWDDILDKM